MYLVVPLSLIGIHLVGLLAAGALVSVPVEVPAPEVILAVVVNTGVAPSSGNAINIGITSGSVAKFTNGIAIDDLSIASGGYAINIGSQTASANSASQAVSMNFYNSSGVEQSLKLLAINYCLQITSPENANGITLGTNNGGNPFIIPNGSGSANLNLYSLGSANVISQDTFQIAGLTTPGVLVNSSTGVVSTASFAANGSVATTVTSLGPTGSHTTIQEWLVITDASGTIRYIPCY